MHRIPETRVNRPLGTAWDLLWPLVFVCSMTVLSMVSQKYSGYSAPQTAFAQTAQPSPSAQ